jgi:hypothetical protein
VEGSGCGLTFRQFTVIIYLEVLRKDAKYCCQKLRVFYHVPKMVSRKLDITEFYPTLPTEWICLAVALLNHIREVLGSSLGRDTICPGLGFFCYLSPSRQMTVLCHDRFLPDSFRFIYHLTL